MVARRSTARPSVAGSRTSYAPPSRCTGKRLPQDKVRLEQAREDAMGKVVECAKVDPSSGCKQLIRGKDESELMKNAVEHAKKHGLRDVTPELEAKVRASIHDE